MPIPNYEYLRSLTALPALTPLESALALAWLNEHWREYDSVEFNVRLGEGIQLPAGSPEFMARFARAATTKRADLILHAGAAVTIVEVKIRLGGSAVGQLQLYRKLYAIAHPDVTEIHLIAAGQTIEPDVHALYDDHAVLVELFPNVIPQS